MLERRPIGDAEALAEYRNGFRISAMAPLGSPFGGAT